eukprot:scaffold7738_cov107-Isochrysis_galbana.AAC.18
MGGSERRQAKTGRTKLLVARAPRPARGRARVSAAAPAEAEAAPPRRKHPMAPAPRRPRCLFPSPHLRVVSPEAPSGRHHAESRIRRHPRAPPPPPRLSRRPSQRLGSPRERGRGMRAATAPRTRHCRQCRFRRHHTPALRPNCTGV